MRYIRSLLCAAIFSAQATAGFAAAMTRIGEHPVSPLTAYPNLHSLTVFNGRIYIGYGDYNDYPVNVIVSYAPAENAFRLEHSAGTDATDLFRVLEGRLFVPAVDPVHYDDFRELSYLTPGLGWRDRAPAGIYHGYDAAQAGGVLFLAGARDAAEGVGTGGAALLRSRDDGRSWSVAAAVKLPRFYWCFALGDRVWTQAGYFEGNTFTASPVFEKVPYLYKGTLLPGGFIVGLANRSPTGSGKPGTLVAFDGASMRTLGTGVLDFCWDGTTLYQLSAAGIARATQLAASGAGATWARSDVSVPPGARALAVHDGLAFVAVGSALYGAKLDGSDFAAGTPTVLNDLPDSFGRGLAIHGNRVVVGAPDAGSAALPLSGRATVWDADKAGGVAGRGWHTSATLAPPNPDCSGWFGKDVGLRRDLLVIVEAGHDTTNKDRGSSARVHLFQLAADTWMSRAVLTVPFAHSALLDDTMLFVGTGNPAPNQATGRPGVNVYRITRDEQNVASLTFQRQLAPGSNRYGYKPIARVARAEDRLIAGWAGDPSRAGGRGLVSVWQKAEGGAEWTAAPIQELTATKEERHDQFGFAVAADEKVLAVGAPRDDAAASQAGAVYLHEWNGQAYARTQTILSPEAQPEANFGAAVALRGNKLLVGAPGVTVSGTPHVGAVYLYERKGASWRLARQLSPPPGSLAEFGIEVAIGERWMAAGSRFSKPDVELAARITVEPIASDVGWESKSKATQ